MTREEAIRYLVDKAGELGIELEVLASSSRELSVDTHDGNVSELKQAERGGVGVRAVVDGKVGYAWSEELSPEALDWTLAEASENASLQDETEGFLPAGKAMGRHDLLSEGLSAPVEEKVERALRLENELKRDPRYSGAQSVRYLERENRETVASTAGASGDYRKGYAGLLGVFMMREGDSIKQGLGVDGSKEFHDLDPAVTAQNLLNRTGRLLGARPLSTGRYRAYLEPGVVGTLIRVLEFALSGKSLVEGKSRLEGKVGQKVGSELLTLVDDPHHPEGLANRPFDSEGTPAHRTALIERGVLRSFLHNSATARKAGHVNTGHAYRSYNGTLGVSPSNLVLESGDGVDAHDGVIVTELMGVHAGANPVTGDFSLQALGLRAEGGESYPVENFVISGNLFRLFEAVSGVGNDPEWDVMTDVLSPMLEVESLSFGGA